MDHSPSVVSLSAVDEQRFGIRTARAMLKDIGNFQETVKFCRNNEVLLLISRCPASRLDVVQVMESAGFLLMDTLVYYARNLTKTPIPANTSDVAIRGIRAGDEIQVQAVAARSFKGYFGHYHADSRLNRTRCDEAYTSWAVNSCVSRDVADEVLIATDDRENILGFATLRLNRDREGEGVLFGVAPEAQGRGIYHLLMTAAMQWFLEKKCECMLVSTQITNIAVQKVWSRLGFEPCHAYYTFHKWFDGRD